MSARREKPVSVSSIEAYDIILAPLVTEKSTMGSENNQITFRVPLSATSLRGAVMAQSLLVCRNAPLSESAYSGVH